MTKLELIARIAEDTNTSKTAVGLVLESLADVTAGKLSTEGEFTIPGVGKLAVSKRAARVGRNPKTGEAVNIPAANSVKFKALKALKDAVN